MTDFDTSANQHISTSTEPATTIIHGTIERIKFERENRDKSTTITFILSKPRTGQRQPQEFMINAWSKAHGTPDYYGIHHLIGEEVECLCYVNGRIKETPKGQFHTIDLNLSKITKL